MLLSQRRLIVYPIALLASVALLAAQRIPPTARRAIGHTIAVPLDYDDAATDTFALYYELGRPFEPAKPTVFVVGDGQQFYVAAGAVPALQDTLFGDDFNVVGVVGRGTATPVLGRIEQHGVVDWARAWQLLKADQWVQDLERVRRAVVGERGRISLYGRSGGGLLVHQYLSRYPEHITTVFTQAAVNRFIDAELGLSSDTFWTDIGTADPALRVRLLDALSRHPGERTRIMLLLQRQNFFAAAEAIQAERAALIDALYTWDEAALERYAKSYQVDAVAAMLEKPNPSVNVRLFELFAPVLITRRTDDLTTVDPDIEVGRLFSAPLLELLRTGHIASPSMDVGALRRVTADVYMLAGRFDHTADYRAQIALASYYSTHRLLLLADGHDFIALQRTGLYPKIVQSALLRGSRGPQEAGIEKQLEPLRYREY